ncbi:hypothetical protein B0H14DRAFT_3556197 [Mycena olivaceomarginata]|nr:hypothetical protein B0H14DRAFT_3556197 [Mycena olivaceomarginata]
MPISRLIAPRELLGCLAGPGYELPAADAGRIASQLSPVGKAEPNLKKGFILEAHSHSKEVNWKGTAGAVVTKTSVTGVRAAVARSLPHGLFRKLRDVIGLDKNIGGRIGRYAAVATGGLFARYYRGGRKHWGGELGSTNDRNTDQRHRSSLPISALLSGFSPGSSAQFMRRSVHVWSGLPKYHWQATETVHFGRNIEDAQRVAAARESRWRTFQGCDGERPTCRRCRLHPPRSLNPCTYSHAPVGGTVSLQVEESMQNRIYELEHQLELLNGKTRRSLDLFLHHFARHPFFFLDPTQFQQTALLPDLLTRSLLVAVALWATHVSENPLAESVYSEEELLARAVHHVARDIAAGDTLPQRMLHMIQTEVLLSLYYLDYGRLLEANYHRAGATSLVFISSLHQLGASSQNLVVQGEIFRYKWQFPSVAPSSVLFLDEDGVTGHSPLTLLTKASIQLERTMSFTARAGLPLPSELWAIETRLEPFRSRLPPVDIGHPTDQISLVTHAFVNGAILCLHSPYINVYAEARSKCLTAASCVAVRLADARLAEWEIVDPILGPLLAAVADVLIASLTHVPQASADLQAILSAMQTLARRSPLIQRYLTVTQHQYTAAQQSLGLFGLL